MTSSKLFSKILQEAKKGSVEAMEDLWRVCDDDIYNNEAECVDYLKKLSELVRSALIAETDVVQSNRIFDLHKSVLKSLSPYDFDSFLLFVEWNREPERKFYVPRRKQLLPITEALQGLADDKYDLVCISMPPGTGKSTMAIFFLAWLAGRHPDKPMLCGSHSNAFIRGVYDEMLRVFDRQGEYLWNEAFPFVQVSNTNAKDTRIDLGKRKRFETLQFTSVGSGNAGLYRAEQLLYCDDLVDGIETAMSKDRLDKLWTQYTTDLRQRKIGACKELHIATRWSIHDVIGRLEESYGDSDRAKFIVCSAMNEKDESNFDYPCDAGFTTEFYRQQREIMPDTEWRALYMNQPIEREGQLYAPDELRRYFDLPDREPDAIFAVCDTKTTGSDYCVLPVAYKYGADIYIDGVICDNGKTELVDVRLANILTTRRVQMARFESNAAGGKIAEKVQDLVKKSGGITKITTKYTTAHKDTKILVQSSWVKEHCLFKDDSVVEHDREYRRFLEQLCGYTMMGKNKHDDVPDAMAQLSEYAQTFDVNRIEIIKRPW